MFLQCGQSWFAHLNHIPRYFWSYSQVFLCKSLFWEFLSTTLALALFGQSLFGYVLCDHMDAHAKNNREIGRLLLSQANPSTGRLCLPILTSELFWWWRITSPSCQAWYSNHPCAFLLNFFIHSRAKPFSSYLLFG